tara:strand:- start:1758 stop:2369 length:612 start_codon:yes stop_codon:yes gene_type:complete
MSLSSTDRANRYFAYDLTSLVESDGSVRFGIPPVNSNQFGTSRACLVKISKINLAPSVSGKPIDWYRPASSQTDYLPQGIFVESNINSRNYAQISNDRGDGTTSGTLQNQSTDLFNAVSSNISVPIYSATPEEIAYVSYDDQNSIFDNGLICGLPFGNIVKFVFKEGVKNQATGGNIIHPTQDKTSTIQGFLSVRLEIFVLDQ